VRGGDGDKASRREHASGDLHDSGRVEVRVRRETRQIGDDHHVERSEAELGVVLEEGVTDVAVSAASAAPRNGRGGLLGIRVEDVDASAARLCQRARERCTAVAEKRGALALDEFAEVRAEDGCELRRKRRRFLRVFWAPARFRHGVGLR
jgi:hypothetical protein